MSHRVQVNPGYTRIALPDGNNYDAGDVVTLTDEEYDALSPTIFNLVLTDLGDVLDPGETITFDVAKMVVYGHSLAYGGGASDTDRDATTHLASMLKMREIPRAIGGAVLHWHQQAIAPGDGGWVHVVQTDIRANRPSTTLNGAVSAGAGTVVVASATGMKVGDLIHIGTGSMAGTGGEVLWITNIVTNTLTIKRLDGTASTARAHASGEPAFIVPHGWINLNPLYLTWYGNNDLAASPIAASHPDNERLSRRFTDPLKTIISRHRCAQVFESDNTSCVYGGSWGAPGSNPATSSGTSVRQPTADGAAVTLHVPDNFEGGTVVVAFAIQSNLVDSPLWTFTVDGVTHGTGVPPDGYAVNPTFNSWCYRVTGLAPGRHEIVATATELGGGNQWFDWWGVEAPTPPVVIVPGLIRPLNYGLWPGWPNARRTTTLTGVHDAGTTSWTVASTASMYVGTTVTLEEGDGNAETLEVLTVPSGTTFTTEASTRSHADGVSVVYGQQDADIAPVNAKIQALCEEFDAKVVYADVDAVLNKTAAFFWHDGAHFSDLGHSVLTEVFYNAIRGSLTARLAAYTSAPAAPLPSIIFFPSKAWTNMPAALTEIYGGVAGHRHIADLRRVFEGRFVVGVITAGAATASLRIQYSLDAGATWKYLFRTPLYAEDTTHEAMLTPTGMKDSGWRPIAAEAIADNVYLRIVGIGGDAVLDPNFGAISLTTR